MTDCEQQIYSNEYQDYLIEHTGDEALIKQWYGTDCVQFASRRFAVIYQAATVEDAGIRARFLQRPRCYGLLSSEQILNEIGVSAVRRLPALELFGNGVLVGFVDTGIDYTHPAFMNADGTSRILSIWDQTIEGGEKKPKGFAYGCEYSNEQINEAISASNPYEIVPSRDTEGHGTFMAGVACGNETEDGQFSGVAPSAAICVVKCKQAKQNLRDYYQISSEITCFSEADLILGVCYLWRQAVQMRMPLVLCLGVGTNLGGHVRGGVIGELLRDYGDYRGTFVVTAAGNEANTARHYESGVILQGGSEEVELEVAEGRDGFVMELWSDATQVFSIGLISPSGEYSGKTVPRQAEKRVISFLFENTVVEIQNLLIDQENGDECILLLFLQPQEGVWKIRVFNEQNMPGRFHIWLPMYELLPGDTRFLRSDPNTTICDPANNLGVITVAYYDSTTRGIAVDSSRGYSRDDYIKPDVAAPGIQVLGPIAFTGMTPADTQRQRAEEARYGMRNGSSIAAALTAGTVALLAEWGIVKRNDLSMDTTTIKKYLIRGTDRTGREFPNRMWGYGFLNLYGVFDALRPK